MEDKKDEIVEASERICAAVPPLLKTLGLLVDSMDRLSAEIKHLYIATESMKKSGSKGERVHAGH